MPPWFSNMRNHPYDNAVRPALKGCPGIIVLKVPLVVKLRKNLHLVGPGKILLDSQVSDH